MASTARERVTAQQFLQLPETSEPIELIDGAIIVSPTPKYAHQKIVGEIYTVLRQTLPNGTLVLSPMDVILDDSNIVQPDVFWVGQEASKCVLGDDGYWHGAPDLVVEVLSPSTEFRDRGAKFRLYEQHGVREYWLAQPESEYVEVYRLEAGKFARHGVFGKGETFTGGLLAESVVSVNALLGIEAAQG